MSDIKRPVFYVDKRSWSRSEFGWDVLRSVPKERGTLVVGCLTNSEAHKVVQYLRRIEKLAAARYEKLNERVGVSKGGS